MSMSGPSTKPRWVARGWGSVRSGVSSRIPVIEIRSRSRVRAAEGPDAGRCGRSRPYARSTDSSQSSRSWGVSRVSNWATALMKVGPSALTGVDCQSRDASKAVMSDRPAIMRAASRMVCSGGEPRQGRLAPKATTARLTTVERPWLTMLGLRRAPCPLGRCWCADAAGAWVPSTHSRPGRAAAPV